MRSSTTTYAEHYVRWGIIAHIVHNGVILRFSDVNTQQSEQFQIKIRHAKFQCKLLKPPKNPSDVSWPLSPLITLKSQKRPCFCAFRKQNPPGFYKSVVVMFRLLPRRGPKDRGHLIRDWTPILTRSPKYWWHGSEKRFLEFLHPLLSTGSKFKSDFSTNFSRADKNWHYKKTMRFPRKLSKHLTLFCPETVNI